MLQTTLKYISVYQAQLTYRLICQDISSVHVKIPNPIIPILYMPIIGLMFRDDGEFWGLVGIEIAIGQRCVYVH
jgi:hypothetical protein